MSDILQPPAVDPAGNITLHGRGGLPLELEFQDAAGAPRDVTGLAMFFEVDGLFRIALGAGSASNKRTLQITDEQAGALVGLAPKPFAFRDESGVEPDVFWSGTIRAIGFKDQPA